MGEEQVRVPLGRNSFIGGDNFDTLNGLFKREDARMPSLIILTGTDLTKHDLNMNILFLAI